MRVALLSDIHGNRWALDAVIRALPALHVDLVLNAGDLLSGPLDPEGTADRLMALGWPTLRGNHERQLLACASGTGAPSDLHAFAHTREDQRHWLEALPSSLRPDGTDIHVCHGTPADDLQYFLERVGPDGVRPARAEEVERDAAGIDASLLVCGHSHRPGACALADGRLVVNPGSVGLQAYDDDFPYYHWICNGTPHARFAVCERGEAGWSVAWHAVAYDHAAAAATAARNGRPEWARWLMTGRVDGQ